MDAARRTERTNMTTLRYFLITNTTSGLDLGIFAGECADYAIRLMLDDAGCGDERADSSIKAIEVDAASVSDEEKAQIERLREENGWNE
jgi:hypothetical protein